MNEPSTLKGSSARHTEATIETVIPLEEQVWKAAQKRDVEGFIRLVPADAVMIFQRGIVPQPDYVATMPERTISHYELRNIRGFMPAPDIVILIYEATSKVARMTARTRPRGEQASASRARKPFYGLESFPKY